MYVSVIIPYHNEGTELLARAVRSVSDQDYYDDLEVIVVDDCSLNPPHLNDDFRCPVTFVRTPENRYAPGARNFGATVAKGQLLTFLDADDEYLPGRIATHADLFQQYPTAVLATGPCLENKSQETSFRWFINHCCPEFKQCSGLLPRTIQPDVMFDCSFTTNMITCPARIFHEVGGFDERLRCWEEWDFVVRISQLGDVAWHPLPGAIYHHRAESITTTRNPAKYETGAAMISRWLSDFPTQAQKHRVHLRSKVSANLLLAAQIYFEERSEPGRAFRLAVASLRNPSIWGLRSTLRYAIGCLGIPPTLSLHVPR